MTTRKTLGFWGFLLTPALVLGAIACSDPPREESKEPASQDAGTKVDSTSSDAGLPQDGTSSASPDVTPAPEDGGATAKLTLASITPGQGKASGGESVMLKGTGFQAGMQVLVGGSPVPGSGVFVLDKTSAQVTMPPHDTGLVDVAVLIPGDPPLSATLPAAFLYYNDVVLTKIDPPEGPVTGGTPVTISGSGLQGKTTVLIGGKPAIDVKVVADDEVLAVTPPGVFGPAHVHVVNERGTGLLKKAFFYNAPPTVTALQPGAGPTMGGNVVTLTGSGLTKEAEITIGGAKAAVLEAISTTTVKIAVPPGQAGKADVAVKTKYGIATLAGGYVYTNDKGQAATQILSIAPAQGPMGGGNTLAIIATGLTAASDTTVLIGKKSAKVLSVAPAAHTALVVAPASTISGFVDVTLLTSKGTHSLQKGYAYLDTLTIASVQPASGTPEGGTAITIKGAGFAKGKATVQVGALPASAVQVVSDGEIKAQTPPGAPGYVDVRVTVDGQTAILPKGFAYVGKDLQLYVPFPNSGAQAGGTFVHLYGTGFVPSMEVRFGGNPATHFTFIDPSHVTVKTPPGQVGAVDVEVAAGGKKSVLPLAFTYFNPMAAYGGTWGAEIDGSVNVTVLDGEEGKPVPDAFVMLWTDPMTPYQGFTNADGQITFSGEDLIGKQMVSASKEGYESASVVLFDAANVTLHLQPIPPPSPGSPPPGQPPPTVAGHVVGLDKYVFVPVDNCALYQGKLGTTCMQCSADSDCGGTSACVDIGEGNGKRCVPSCEAGCPSKFQCMAFEGTGRCAPVKGEVTSVCFHTKPTILSRDHWPPEGPGFEAKPSNGFKYKITTSYGEQAIVCFGGYKQWGAQLVADDANSLTAFTATVMGVKRHLMVLPKEKYEAVDVLLNLPLSKKANLRLDNPPAWTPQPGSFVLVAAWGYLVLGADGVIKMPDQAQKMLAPFAESEPDHLVLDQLPTAFQGDIHDASLTLLALDVELDGLGESQVPVSITVKNDVKDLGNDSMVRRQAGGDFEAVETGIQKNIYGMWGSGPKDLWAVGAQGLLVHWDGGGWTLQANPVGSNDDLRGVYGADKSHVWVVGANGAAAEFNGSSWQPLLALTGKPLMNGVFAAPDLPLKDGGTTYLVWAATQGGLYQLVQQGPQKGFQKVVGAPSNPYLAIHGTDKDHVWAVGMYGQAVAWDGVQWKSMNTGTSIALRGVWAHSPTAVFAVGEKGQALKFDGKVWKVLKTGTQHTLTSVWGSAENDVWAAGARGTLLHWDGKTWKSAELKAVDKSLNAVWAGPAGDVFALGEQELVLGPLLYPPLAVMPQPGGQLVGNTLKWNVDPSTVEPHFNYLTIGIPGMGGDTPVWHLITKGNVTEVELPDFPAIQGTPGIPKGKTLHLTVMRVYKEGFDIDAHDSTDLNTLSWRSWSMHDFLFTKQ